jgi:2-C-methyl-D-erythritol 4-phosphate cytidylyltransferase
MRTADTFWAIVPAAGVGRRMQQGSSAKLPKQYLPLFGKTVIEHSLERVLAVPQISRVLVAVSPEDEYWTSLAISRDPRLERVIGGKDRHNSVFNALAALADRAAEDDWVLVHDAVRPCVTPGCIETMIRKLSGHAVGGLLGFPLADTLKKVDDGGLVKATVDRTGVWAAATPQMFRYGVLTKALREFIATDRLPTDEAMAIESLSLPVKIVAGRRDNIKITVPGDLELAATILSAQQSSEEI